MNNDRLSSLEEENKKLLDILCKMLPMVVSNSCLQKSHRTYKCCDYTKMALDVIENLKPELTTSALEFYKR